MEESAVETELAAVAQRPPDDPPQHVAAALVGGHDAVGQQKRRGADVIRDHPVGGGELAGRVVGPLDECADGVEQRHEEIGVVVGLDALHDGGDAFEPGAGVDGGAGQRFELPRRIAVELHEDEIPDLDDVVALAVDERRSARRQRVGTTVEVDLGARPAGSGLAHGPVVVLLAETQDAIRRGADLLPQRGGLVVIGVDREPQPLDGHAVDIDEQVPRELDRLFLEIVAEAEVAEHLEEGVVASGVADVFEIVVLAAGADALLR